MNDYQQMEWDVRCEHACRQLVRLAVAEDLDRSNDWTTIGLVPTEAQAEARVVARERGVISGLRAAQVAATEMHAAIEFTAALSDGTLVFPGTEVARLRGAARDLLTCERIILNFIGRLSGIATKTRQFVDAIAGTSARIYDTRKTTPGWRLLEKYAVRSGGGFNHRLGLFDGVLIKDNHLAFASDTSLTPGQAVTKMRNWMKQLVQERAVSSDMILEVEVDTLEQFLDVVETQPDIVLLDNMTTDQLRSAVSARNQRGLTCELEASGGVSLATVRAIAESGVDRISVGGLTHSAPNFDVGLDWISHPIS